MPVPSGRRSRLRTGGGFTISNPRKSIKPSSRDFHAIGTAIRVMSWPATSSITTNCGSFRPLARATRVAAGIPTSTAVAAKKTAAQGCHAGAINLATNHQRRTVAADPQVPGPGRMCPTPKKVATSVAHTEARGRDAPETAGGTPALRSEAGSAEVLGVVTVFVAPASRRLSGGRLAHPPKPIPNSVTQPFPDSQRHIALRAQIHFRSVQDDRNTLAAKSCRKGAGAGLCRES